MKTNINIKALKISPKGETLLMEVNAKTFSILTPKPLTYDQILFIEEWKLEDMLPLKYQDCSSINQVNMLKREFILNKKFLNEEFMLLKNKEKRYLYFSNFSSKALEL